jgi:hypothetical protein
VADKIEAAPEPETQGIPAVIASEPPAVPPECADSKVLLCPDLNCTYRTRDSNQQSYCDYKKGNIQERQKNAI